MSLPTLKTPPSPHPYKQHHHHPQPTHPPSGCPQATFLRFGERHRRLLNAYLRRNPALLETSLAPLVRAPKLIDFDNKRAWFRWGAGEQGGLKTARGRELLDFLTTSEPGMGGGQGRLREQPCVFRSRYAGVPAPTPPPRRALNCGLTSCCCSPPTPGRRSKVRAPEERRYGTLGIRVRRANVFEDSFNQLRSRTPEEMRCKLSVMFSGEEGVDAGGVSREWYQVGAAAVPPPGGLGC